MFRQSVRRLRLNVCRNCAPLGPAYETTSRPRLAPAASKGWPRLLANRGAATMRHAPPPTLRRFPTNSRSSHLHHCYLASRVASNPHFHSFRP
jgi:hypothetical protein